MPIAEWAVTTWNLRGSKLKDLDRVGEVIGATSSDVVTLQEVRRPQADRLASLIGMRSTWAFKHHAFAPLDIGRAEGAAILTPHRLRDARHATVSVHRSPRNYRRRIAQWASIDRDDGSHGDCIFVLNVHLSPHDEPDLRLGESHAIAGLAGRYAGEDPIVVAGDFNDDLEPEVRAALPGIEHIAVPPTNPSEAPDRFLDHVMLPPWARDVSVSVPAGGPEWEVLSDHLPVTVRFTLSAAGS